MRPRAWAIALVLGILLLPASGLAPGRPAAYRPAAVGLALTAGPLNGSAPLTVEFRAAITPSNLTATFHWSFGDGTTYLEVTTSYSALSHSYALAGSYLASVDVQSSDGNANATVTVRAVPATLADAINATPASGVAPVTIHFSARPSGGTGTYTSFRWSFGDGDVGTGSVLDYTYPTPGTYNVSLVVEDSSGRNATAYTEIHVAAGPVPPGSPGIPAYAYVAIPLASAIAGAAMMAFWWQARAGRRARDAETSLPTTPRSPPEVGPSVGPPSPEEMAEATASRPGAEDSSSLSERILVHLYWYGRSNVDGLAKADASQAGISRRLGVPQNSVSKAVRRLVDAGAVAMELQHVPGASRRLRTYRLTPRGEAVARSLRSAGEKRSSR